MDHGGFEWKVFLLGGASGTGKTSISYRLARHFGVGITEVDDFQIVLQRMTSARDQPILHECWSPEAAELPVERLVELQIAVAEAMMPALEGVIGNHIETNTPVILEGDYIHPALASRLRGAFEAGQVGALFLHEPDEAQLVRNLARREPERGFQEHRARVSWAYGRWLSAEAGRLGLPVAEARPWETVFDRAVAVMRPEAGRHPRP